MLSSAVLLVCPSIIHTFVTEAVEHSDSGLVVPEAVDAGFLRRLVRGKLAQYFIIAGTTLGVAALYAQDKMSSESRDLHAAFMTAQAPRHAVMDVLSDAHNTAESPSERREHILQEQLELEEHINQALMENEFFHSELGKTFVPKIREFTDEAHKLIVLLLAQLDNPDGSHVEFIQSQVVQRDQILEDKIEDFINNEIIANYEFLNFIQFEDAKNEAGLSKELDEFLALINRLLYLLMAAAGCAGVYMVGLHDKNIKLKIKSLQDLTDRLRRSQEKERTARQAAEDASSAKSEFLANMSHELRTPLNSIIGFSDIIGQDRLGIGTLPQQYGEYARDIHGSGEHLLNLINDILDLSKVEAGKLEITEENDIGLRGFTDHFLDLMRPQFKNKPALMFKNCISAEDTPLVRMDKTKLRQIMLNLLSNAGKFTPDGGEVSVTTRMEENGDLSIIVQDNGAGLDAEGLKKAMERFGQAKSAYLADYQGTGIGLPLVKGLVELHGGTFTLESDGLSKGVRATVRLPHDRVVSLPMQQCAAE